MSRVEDIQQKYQIRNKKIQKSEDNLLNAIKAMGDSLMAMGYSITNTITNDDQFSFIDFFLRYLFARSGLYILGAFS